MERYPRITAHIISESLGYATPTRAAIIGFHGMRNEPNNCEWVDACYQSNARKVLENSIRSRHFHKGYMAEYKLAKAIVDHAINTREEPILASWF